MSMFYGDFPLNDAVRQKTKRTERQHEASVRTKCENDDSVKVTSVPDHFTQSQVCRLRGNVTRTGLIQMNSSTCSLKKVKPTNKAALKWFNSLKLITSDYFQGAGNLHTTIQSLLQLWPFTSFELLLLSFVFGSFFIFIFIAYWNSFRCWSNC